MTRWHFREHVGLLAAWPIVTGLPVVRQSSVSGCNPPQWVPQHNHPACVTEWPPLRLKSLAILSAEADCIACPQRLWSLGPYIRRSTGLSLFSPVPQPSRLGQAGTYTDVPISRSCSTFRCTKSPRRFALLSRSAVFQDPVTDLPSPPTLRRTFTLDLAPEPIRLVGALACWLEPLPPSLCRTTNQRHS